MPRFSNSVPSALDEPIDYDELVAAFEGIYQNEPPTPTRETPMPRQRTPVAPPRPTLSAARYYWCAVRGAGWQLCSRSEATACTSEPREPNIGYRGMLNRLPGSPIFLHSVPARARPEVTPSSMEVLQIHVQNLHLPQGVSSWMDYPGSKMVTDAEVRVFSEEYRRQRTYLHEKLLWAEVRWRTNTSRYSRVYQLDWSDATDFMDLLATRYITWFMMSRNITNDGWSCPSSWVTLRAPRQ